MSDDWLAGRFEGNRARLRSMAYRMLGSLGDAEDAVQEAWIHVAGADADTVANLDGWFTTIVARVCLDMLRSRKSRREEPVESPDDMAQAAAGPEQEAVLADSVGLALLVVLDNLAPAERVAFVLHDMFGVPFDEIAGITGRSPDAARQLASRARRRVRGAPSADHPADFARQREVATAFLQATRTGDFTALVELLDADVVLTGDAFITPAGRPMVLQGLEKVARGAVASAVRAEHSQLAVIDGQVGIVYAPAGRLQIVLAFAVSPDSKITRITVTASPVTLRRMQLAMLPE